MSGAVCNFREGESEDTSEKVPRALIERRRGDCPSNEGKKEVSARELF
jgi:hypothetical protein